MTESKTLFYDRFSDDWFDYPHASDAEEWRALPAAEFDALRARLALAEAVVEAARPLVEPGCECGECAPLAAALCAYGAAKEGA